MLYKVWAIEVFADMHDRIGVVEADSLDAAIDELKAWSEESLAVEEYEQTADPEITRGEVWAQVSFPMQNVVDGYTGCDTYMIVPVGAKRLMFCAEDWLHHFS